MSCYDNNKGHGGKHDSCCDKRPGGIGMPDSCCTGNEMCTDFNRNLSNVKVEPIYTQKVYDAALFHLQSLVNGMDVPLRPSLSAGTRIVEVLDIRCRKRFTPTNTQCGKNLTITPETTLQGAEFIKDGQCDLTAVGPDGFRSQKLIYVDTEDCDKKCKGTPIYGTQTINITGNVDIEIDVNVRENCGRRCKVTLRGTVPVAPPRSAGLNLTNFFELCVPSTTDGAFFPRFTEFCNLKCQPRLATNNINRDFKVTEKDGKVNLTANMMIALCVSCEKKIIVPVQLCVLSTGFTKLSPETSSVCNSYPSLFPNQIDKDSVKECLDNKSDKDDCRKPCKPGRSGNDNSFRGLSLSEDETENLDEI